MQFRKLEPEEAEARKNKRGGRAAVDLTEYKDNLQQLTAGEIAEVTYDSAEERRTHVGRYRKAAKELGLKISWNYERNNNRAFLTLVGPAETGESGTGDGSTPENIATPRRRRSREAEVVAA